MKKQFIKFLPVICAVLLFGFAVNLALLFNNTQNPDDDRGEAVAYKLVKDDSNLHVEIKEAFVRKNDLYVKFSHNSSHKEPVSIIGDVDYTLSKREAKPGEQISLKVDNWQPQMSFRLKVGSESEIMGFGRDLQKQETSASSVFSTENPYSDFNKVNMTFDGTNFFINVSENAKAVAAKVYVQTTLGKFYLDRLSSFSPLIDKQANVEKRFSDKNIKFGWNLSNIPNPIKANVRGVGLEFSESLTIEGKNHRIDDFSLIGYDDKSAAGFNYSINSTSLHINVSDLNNIVIDPTVFVDTAVISDYPTQRKMFWDGNTWFVFYRAGGNVVYNYSTDLSSWNAGKNSIEVTHGAGARPAVLYKNISNNKTIFLGLGQNGGTQFNISRGTINADNGLNITNNLTMNEIGRAS